MSELEGLIRYWKSIKTQTSCLLSPATLAHVEGTIKYLVELQTLWEDA